MADKSNLTESKTLNHLLEVGPKQKHLKGQMLLYQGDRVSQFFYIRKGFVRAYAITDDGEERTMLILGTGDLFPLLKDPERPHSVSLYFYEVMQDCELSIVPQEDLLDCIKKDQLAAWAMLRYTSEFSAVLANRIALLEGKSAEDKLLQLFEYLITVSGKKIGLNTYMLQLKLTHQDIANLLSHTRETTSVSLKNLEKQGTLTHSDGLLVIKKEMANLDPKTF